MGGRVLILQRGRDKPFKEWSRAQRPRLKLRVELNGDKEGMRRQLHDLRQVPIHIFSGDPQTLAFNGPPVFRIKLVAMSVALLNLSFPIERRRQRTGL